MKTILITGASSGIGWALAVRAARAGYAVFAVGRNRDALDALRAKIESENGFVAVDATDIAVAGNAPGLIARALARFESIDVLVNNAGFASAGALAAQSDAELQRQFGTHVIGPLALVRESLDALSRARGHVFMLGSGVARVPVGSLGAYPPAKAALRSATAILRRELHVKGIAVTYIDPGAVDTPFMRRAGMPGAPARVLVSPEEVARKILISVAKRPRTLNAVPWQTTVVALAERFPRVTDLLLERFPTLVGGDINTNGGTAIPPPAEIPEAADRPSEPAPAVSAIPVRPESTPVPRVEPASEPRAEPQEQHARVPTASGASSAAERLAEIAIVAPESTAFETALEPHRRRMEKLNFRESFVRELLVAGATLDLGEIALRWAGMPNKHERAVTHDVLEALANSGFLELTTEHTYRVVRTP